MTFGYFKHTSRMKNQTKFAFEIFFFIEHFFFLPRLDRWATECSTTLFTINFFMSIAHFSIINQFGCIIIVLKVKDYKNHALNVKLAQDLI